MTELIRRQDAELILAREMFAKSLEDGCDPVSPVDFLPEAKAWLKDAPAIRGWIPVSERLPEEYAQYLVCDEDGECCVYWLEDAYWARRDIEQEHIVAWMPLPPAYKEENDE